MRVELIYSGIKKNSEVDTFFTMKSYKPVEVLTFYTHEGFSTASEGIIKVDHVV
jgi:hypothetical protein